ncbi:MAG: HNH endonuclease [Candidatus Diapherotrites archaeon]|nr:HNH endonuclease [Candidatus Diapherotrites archaeon]
MKKALFLAATTLLFLSFVYSLDCQYAISVPSEQTFQNVYSLDTNELITTLYPPATSSAININNFLDNSFDTHNETDFLLTVRMQYKWWLTPSSICSGSGIKYQREQTFSINPRDYYRLNTSYDSSYCRFEGYEDISFSFVDNNFTYQKYELISNTTCKKCPSGSDTNCLNDGATCTSDSLCGSGFCVKEICSTESEKIKQDVLDNQAALIAKQKAEREGVLTFTGIIVILIITISIVLAKFYLDNKKQKAEQQNKFAETNLKILKEKARIIDLEITQNLHKERQFNAELEKLKNSIKQKRKQLTKLDSEYGAKESDLEAKLKKKEETAIQKMGKRLIQMENDKNSISESTKLLKKERIQNEKERLNLEIENNMPRLNKQGYKVIINEEGYETFAKNLNHPGQPGEYFHRWYAKKFIYNKNRNIYRLPWISYEVHHKDFAKRNNELSNLEVLTREEHKKDTILDKLLKSITN